MNRRKFLGTLAAVAACPPIHTEPEVNPFFMPMPVVPNELWKYLKKLEAEMDAYCGADPMLLKARQIGLSKYCAEHTRQRMAALIEAMPNP